MSTTTETPQDQPSGGSRRARAPYSWSTAGRPIPNGRSRPTCRMPSGPGTSAGRATCFAGPPSAPRGRNSSGRLPTARSRRSTACCIPAGDVAAFHQVHDENEAGTDDLEAARAWWLRRMLLTPHPLLEKLTLFWHGHFAASIDKVGRVSLMVRQIQLLRSHALGRFDAMLLAVAHDPAMLDLARCGRQSQGPAQPGAGPNVFGNVYSRSRRLLAAGYS